MFLLDLILPRYCFSCKDAPINTAGKSIHPEIGFAGIASELRPFEDLSEINRKHREVLRELENRLETFKNKKEDNKMCKLGDKDYWQVGDEVFCMKYGKGVIDLRDTDTCLIRTRFKDNEYCTYYTNGKICIGANVSRTLFHIGAITFDQQGRHIAINYDYNPERTPKVRVTKLPHEFVKGEEVLIRYDSGIGYGGILTCWIKDVFQEYVRFTIDNKEYYVLKNTRTATHCIPYKGNEHLENKTTKCDSGKVPEDYVFPKEEHVFKPFDKVLVRHSKIATWEIDFFSSYGKNVGFRLRCLSGYYEYCLPFEGNEELLGTTNSPEE